jgi:hypothetical protein
VSKTRCTPIRATPDPACCSPPPGTIVFVKTPVCATCGQPGTRDLSQNDTWECGNEACSEFGQVLASDEPPSDPPGSPPEAQRPT